MLALLRTCYAVDEFGYLSVIVSVILGLSITQLLQGLSQIINARDRVRIYWPALGWAVLLLLVDVQAWWAMFGLRLKHDWTFLQFTVVLLESIILYLLAALIMPGIRPEGQVDLREDFFRHSGWFFGALVALLIDSLLKSLIINGSLPPAFDLSFHVVWIVTAAVAMFVPTNRYQYPFVCFSFAMVVAYIAILFGRLR
jgi:hypothetical protein